MKRVLIAFVAAVSLSSFTQHACAADESLVREYIKKSDFRASVENGVRQVTSKSADMTETYARFAGNINIAAIEDRYVRALMSHLSNSDVNALMKSLEIPGLQEAVVKQAQALASISSFVMKEVEGAAVKAGLPVPPRQPASAVKNSEKRK